MKKNLISLCLGLILFTMSSCITNNGLTGKGCGPATYKQPDFKISRVDTRLPITEDYVLYDRTKIRNTKSNGLHKK